MAPPIGGKSGGTSGKGSVPPEKMSAYERWVLPNMDAPQEREEIAIASVLKRKGDAASASTQQEASTHEDVAPLTAEDVEAIRQAAYEEGYQEGKDAGYKEGKEQGHKLGYDEGYKSGQDDVRSISLRLGQICRALLDPIPANDDQLEEALKSLVTSICTQVVQRELTLDSSGVMAVVKEALECLQPGNKRIRIHLNPDDIDIVERELRNLNQWENQWRLLAHRTITRGGCIIDTDDSIVDARAEKRLGALLHQIYSKDAAALNQESTPRDSLAQVFGEIATFAPSEEAETPPSSPTAQALLKSSETAKPSSETSPGETARQTRSEATAPTASDGAGPESGNPATGRSETASAEASGSETGGSEPDASVSNGEPE